MLETKRVQFFDSQCIYYTFSSLIVADRSIMLKFESDVCRDDGDGDGIAVIEPNFNASS